MTAHPDLASSSHVLRYENSGVPPETALVPLVPRRARGCRPGPGGPRWRKAPEALVSTCRAAVGDRAARIEARAGL